MDKYARGGLPNTKGEMLDGEKSRIPTLKGGKIQQAPGTVALGPTLFRCICGLDSAEVLSLQASLLNKTIILKKGKQTSHMVDMEQYAWDMKVDKVLKVSIIDFFNDLTMETMTWDQICEKFKLSHHEYKQLKSYTHGFVKDCLNRTKKNPSLPKSAITLLHHLYRASMGQGSSEISTPWTIKAVGLDVQKLEAVCQPFHVSFQLAIMDARGFCEDLSVDTFSSITNCLNIMNSCLEYIIVCFVDFINIGCLVEGVRSQSGKVHYEVGTITKDNEQSITSGVSAYASVVLFVSKANAFESIDKALGQKVFISTTASTRGDKIDADFIFHLIEGFSPEQNYVLDLFSGGVVLQQCLMSKRRCIALCRDDLEAMTLEAKCSQILEDNPQIQEWCGAQTSSKKQVIELDDDERDDLDNLEIDVQPAGDDEDEEDDNDTKERSSSDEDEEGNKEKPDNRGAGQSSGDDQGKSDAEQCDKNKDKDKDKEEASYAHKSNEDKDEEGEDNLNKASNDADDSSKIGRLET